MGSKMLRNKFDSPSWRQSSSHFHEDHLVVGEETQVMQSWERPLMRKMAEYATRNRGRVLEVGFGMGISASEIMTLGCDDYVVIEPHPEIASRARSWGRQQGIPVTVVEDFWQNVFDKLGRFDGVLFDVYAVNEEADTNNFRRFLPLAHHYLSQGGGVTYYSGQTRAVAPDHMSLLLSNFSVVELTIVEGLNPPRNCKYWQSDHMMAAYLRGPINRDGLSRE